MTLPKIIFKRTCIKSIFGKKKIRYLVKFRKHSKKIWKVTYNVSWRNILWEIFLNILSMKIISLKTNTLNRKIVKHTYKLILRIILKGVCETKVWLISVLIITKQSLKLMIIFQVWLGNTIFKVTITKTNQAKEKSWRRRRP